MSLFLIILNLNSETRQKCSFYHNVICLVFENLDLESLISRNLLLNPETKKQNSGIMEEVLLSRLVYIHNIWVFIMLRGLGILEASGKQDKIGN